MRKFLAGVGFRSTTPSFTEGQEVSAFVTGYDGTTPLVRVGDTVLRLSDDAADVETDTRVRIRVTRFDDESHRGEAELVAVEGESTF